jgi:hypothetical protein
MEIDQELINDPYWGETDPGKMRLVQLSDPFPPELNPLFDEHVVIRAAGVPGSEATHGTIIRHSKSIIGRRGILHGIQTGRIHHKSPTTGRPTQVVEATSANTGQSMALACQRLGIPFMPIVKSDTPPTKIEEMEKVGDLIKVSKHYDLSETTVQKARRLGAQPGWYNPDQYGSDWNWIEQRDRLAPQLFEQAIQAFGEEPSLLVLPAGTMGTAIGNQMYVQSKGLHTLVVPVMCAPQQEVPGARTRASIELDILFDWKGLFGERIEYGPRYESILLSYLSWPALPHPLGPSFGLGFYGALSFLRKHQQAGTLDQLRRKNGEISVVLFGPDSNALYQHVYPAVLHYNDYAQRRPIDIEKLFASN